MSSLFWGVAIGLIGLASYFLLRNKSPRSDSPDSSGDSVGSIGPEAEEYEKLLKDPTKTAGEITNRDNNGKERRRSVRIVAKEPEAVNRPVELVGEPASPVAHSDIASAAVPSEAAEEAEADSPVGRHSSSPSVSLNDAPIFAVDNLHSHLDPEEKERIANTRSGSISSPPKHRASSPSISSNPSFSDTERLEKRASHRAQVAEEIRQSESKYLTSLKQLYSIYLAPMKQKAKDLKLSPNDLNSIFGNVESIIQFHETFNGALQSTGSGSRSIASVFLQYGAFLKTYIAYTNNYNGSLHRLNELQKHSSAFKKFLKKCRTNTNTSTNPGIVLDLPSYLIMPIQRIPRYSLLIAELLKYTESNDAEYADLTAALESVKSIAAVVNDKKREYESLATMIELANKIKNWPSSDSDPNAEPPLIQPHRKLVRTGLIEFKSTGSSQSQSHSHSQSTQKESSEYLFLLFNDLLVWVDRDSYDYRGLFHIDTEHSGNKIESSLFFANSIELIDQRDKKKGMFLQFAEKEEKESWLSSLKEIQAQAMGKIAAVSSVSKAAPASASASGSSTAS